MSKQKRGPERDERSSRTARGPERPALDPSLVEQGALGNAAVQATLGGGVEASAVGLDVVRDVARPLVDHASLVLQIERSPLHDRLVAIVDASRLPDDRKQELLDRLHTGAAAASVVEQALIDAFGHDSPSLRAALSDALDTVYEALGGQPAAGGWIAGDRTVPLSADALDGAVGDRAAALVRDLAMATTRIDGEGARAFCLAVHLALTLDEEEEEEDIDGLPALDA